VIGNRVDLIANTEHRAPNTDHRSTHKMTSMTEKDYKSTLNLPKTDFPMKADLAKREPAQLAAWRVMNLEAAIRRTGRDAPSSSFTTARPMRTGTFIWAPP